METSKTNIDKHKKKPVYHIQKRKEICSCSEATLFIIGSIVYVALLTFVAYLVTKIPDYDTKSDLFKKAFSRDSHYTTVFSIGKFILWMTLVISGFAFVNQVNLMNQRRSLFRGRDGTHKDFIILVLLSAFIYFLAPIIALRSRHDMQRDLQFNSRFKNETPIENHYPNCRGHLACAEPYPILPPLPEFLRFIIREFSLFFYQLDFPIAPNCCYLFTDYEIVFHNSCFIIAFCIGMNYTHLDFPPFNQFGFTIDKIKQYTCFGWLMLITFVSGTLLNLYYIYHVHFWTNSHWYYIYLTAAILGYSVLRTLWFRKTHYVHLHHWTCGMVGLIYCGFQNLYVAALCGLMAGVMVEGGARWGFDEVWMKIKDTKNNQDSKQKTD